MSAPGAGTSLSAGSRASGRQLAVLMVTNRWPTGSHHGGLFVKQLVDPLRGQGHAVDVEVIAQGRSRLDYALAAWRLRAAAERRRYDIIHVHYGLSAASGLLVSGVPRVISLYGSDINVRWQRWITRISTRPYAARIYVSTRLAELAGDRAAVVIPNGVDFERFTPGDRLATRSALGIEAAERVVLFGASPARPVKGWQLFNDVVAELGARAISVRPMVLTEPGQPVERVVQKLDAADLLLFTSRRGSEGSPTVVKEAIAMGLPVVSVDVGDVGELLAGVTPSAVVPFPDDADAAAAHRALVHRLADEAAAVLATGRRANGREQCRWLDVNVVAERVVGLYRRLRSA